MPPVGRSATSRARAPDGPVFLRRNMANLNPYDSPTSDDAFDDVTSPIARCIVYASMVLGCLCCAFSVFLLFGGPIIYMSMGREFWLMIQSDAVLWSVRVGVLFAVTGLLLLWGSRLIRRRKTRRGAAVILAALLWAGFVIPALV